MKLVDYRKILDEIEQEVKPLAQEGQQATYIPELAKVDPDQFGMCLNTLPNSTNDHKGQTFTIGTPDVPFSIQSISKVFSLAMCLSVRGDKLWKRLGKEPSGTAFNSLIQLEMEDGYPRNPFINAGAIVMADILMQRLPDPEENYLKFVRALCGNPTINYDLDVARSEYKTGYKNAAIANILKYHDNLRGNIKDVLMFYFKTCSLRMSCRDLSAAFLPFAEHRQEFSFAGIKLSSSQVKRINAIMQTCGFYDEAGDYSYLVGLPGKSGVGGGIAAICPRRYSVAVWSPRLNSKGNSVVGIKALELLTTKTEESIF